MEHESVLERRLNGDEDPTDLPLALLKHITNDFSEERKIGQGGFAAVYKGVLRNGTIVAVKRIDVNVYTLDGKSFRREFNSLMFTNHENVVRFLGFCSNTHQTSIKEAGTGKNYLVNVNERMLCLEYISNGSLDKHITDELRGLPWDTRYKIITGICNGLSYLHTEKIIHMDLKPGNILLDDHMVPKITDFGLSRPDENSRTKGQCFGTRGYMAPEYEKDGKTSFKCDIYSLGVIIIELITGCKGVPDKHNVLRRWRHRWSKSPTLLQIQQVTRCIEIAVCCRKHDPKSRPSIVDIVSSLKKSESTNGLTAEISSSCFDEDDMLRIMPLELRLPYELKDEITCFTVELINDTRSCIAFHIQLPSRQQYSAQPYKGIVQPESIYGVKITVFPQAQDVQDHDHVDNLIVQSMKLSGDLRYKVITESMFHQEVDKVVDEVSLMVVYEPASRKSKHGRQIPKRASLSRHYPTNMKYLGKESDRAVDVTRGAMGSLLDKLGKLVTEDYNLEDTMKRDIEYFSEEMKKIHLDLPQLENLDGVKDWINEVRELSYIIEDMLDGFLVHVEHESNWSPFEEVPHDGVKLLESCNNQNGDVMRDIKKKVQDLADRRKKFNYVVKNVTASATAKSTIDFQISAIYEDKEQLIGIKAPRDELIRLIDEDGDVSKEMLRIVSIVGMGGLGKTALAKAVYDKLQAQYHPCAFVRMGQNVDVKIVLKNILAQCRNDAANLEHLDARELIDQLQKLLKSKRYFIVIDDIWDSEAWDTETWGTIRSAFPRNNCGSRVITTTRASHVAMACCYDERRYMHVMKPLSDEYSRRLFFSRVFGSEEACPDALKEDSIDILKRCGGMPLAINSIASLLAGGQPRSTWDNVRKNWGAMLKGNDLEKMKQILEMNYILLPDQVKPCLLHVGMYPDDQEIDKNDLVRQWVAEDFVHGSTDDGLDAEDVAGLFFNLLIGTFMIQPGKIDNYNSKLLTCTVHPIMLDLIRAKAAKENFIHVANGSKDGKGKIHRVSVHYNDKEDDRLLDAIKEGSLSHVRSVLLFQSSLLPYFMEFNYVRVLHLEHKVSSMVLDLTNISRLFLLRFLKVTSDDLEYELKLPNQIGELHQLETIDLHNASLKNYPSDIVSLPWLMHLSLTRKEASVVLPDGIERLKLLRTLVGVDVVESSIENIMGIRRLTNLRKLHICSKGIVQPTNKHVSALHSCITMLSSSLRIFTFECKWTIKLDVPGRVSMALFPRGSHIGELDLGKCEFERCPEWIGQLYNLYKLTIWVREVADGVNIVGGLPSLVYFHLSIARGSEQKEERVFIPGRGAFKSLNHLTFYCQTASLTFEVGAMPKLENLTIMFRYHMTHQFLPVGIEHLPTGTLKEIWLLVAPNDKSQVIGKHRTSVRHLLKGAFKSHHPTAKIVFYFSGGFPVPIDEEDSDNEATRQGNLTLTSVMQNMEKDKGEVINHFTTFFETPAPKEWDPAISREQWINLAAALRSEGYTKKYKEKHGAKSDPRQEPFYDEVAMLAGGDMENGQLWVGDGSVDTMNIPTLSQIFASSTSLQLAIEDPRPDVHMLNQLQTCLDEETRRREEVELNLQRMQELMAQQQAAYEARFAAYDTHFVRLDAMSDGTSQDPLPPLGFNFLHPSVGSKNVPVGGSAHGQASQVTTTGHGASSSSQQ